MPDPYPTRRFVPRDASNIEMLLTKTRDGRWRARAEVGPVGVEGASMDSPLAAAWSALRLLEAAGGPESGETP